jgi:predicted DCC family thiol-disulfide oxidoreductase YuxK
MSGIVPQDRPVLLYDGDCEACRNWAARLDTLTAGRVATVPLQEADPGLLGRPREALEAEVHLVEPDGRFTAGAEAIFRALAGTRRGRLALWAWRWLPGFRPASRWVYSRVAAGRHRSSTGRS